MYINLPAVGYRLPKHFQQSLRHSKVDHSEKKLSPLEIFSQLLSGNEVSRSVETCLKTNLAKPYGT